MTVNSDDPAYFGGYIGRQLRRGHRALDLGHEDLRTLARNAFEGTFVTPERAAEIYAEIDAWHAAG